MKTDNTGYSCSSKIEVINTADAWDWIRSIDAKSELNKCLDEERRLEREKIRKSVVRNVPFVGSSKLKHGEVRLAGASNLMTIPRIEKHKPSRSIPPINPVARVHPTITRRVVDENS